MKVVERLKQMSDFIVLDMISPIVLNFYIQKYIGNSWEGAAFLWPIVIVVLVFLMFVGIALYNFFSINTIENAFPRHAVHSMLYCFLWIFVFYWVIYFCVEFLLPKEIIEALSAKSKAKEDTLKLCEEVKSDLYDFLRDAQKKALEYVPKDPDALDASGESDGSGDDAKALATPEDDGVASIGAETKNDPIENPNVPDASEIKDPNITPPLKNPISNGDTSDPIGPEEVPIEIADQTVGLVNGTEIKGIARPEQVSIEMTKQNGGSLDADEKAKQLEEERKQFITKHMIDLKEHLKKTQKALTTIITDEKRTYDERKHVLLISNGDDMIDKFEKFLKDPKKQKCPCVREYNIASYVVAFACVELSLVRFITNTISPKKLWSLASCTFVFSILVTTFLCKMFNKSKRPLKYVVYVPFLLAPLYAWISTVIYAKENTNADEIYVYSEMHAIFMIVLTSTMYFCDYFDMQETCMYVLFILLFVAVVYKYFRYANTKN